jgi:acyl carrier protein
MTPDSIHDGRQQDAGADLEASTPRVEPRTPTQAVVAAIWGELLGLDAISITDNFFEVGGHSMVAAQVVHELGIRTGVELELETFFDMETLEAVAAEIDRRLTGDLGPHGAEFFEGEL